MTIVMSLSGQELGDCSKVVRLLKTLGINGDVTSNQTILDGVQEPGCRIRLFGDKAKAKRLWEAVRTEHNLTCGHIEVASHESGCIFDLPRASVCPGAS